MYGTVQEKNTIQLHVTGKTNKIEIKGLAKVVSQKAALIFTPFTLFAFICWVGRYK